MEASEFKSAIEALGYTQVGISRLFGVNDRTGRRWASGEQDIPKAVEITLDLMRRFGLSVDVMAQILTSRLSGDYGEPNTEYHVWVRPQGEHPAWTVAKYDHTTKKYLVPGNPVGLRLTELELGPRVYLPE